MAKSLDRKITAGGLIKFALPSIVMMVVMSLYSVVDGTFVARLVGTDAFSAVNIVYPMLSLVIAVGTMFGAGLTAVVSTKLGQGKGEEANRIVTFVVLIMVALGVALAAVALAFLRPIIYLLGADESVYAYCRAYAFPLIFFIPLYMLQLVFQSLYVADSKPQIGLCVTIAGGLCNVILDYVFIAVFGWGIAGAAIATGIGCAVPAVFGLCYFGFHRKGTLRFSRPKADWRALVSSMTNGSSEMVSNLSGSVTTFLFNIIMMKLVGPSGVAAISILMYLDFVLIAIGLGYSMGVAPLISYNYGRGEDARLKAIFRYSVLFCAVIGALMTAGTAVFALPLAGIFASRGTAVYELAVTGLRIYAFGYLFKGYNIFCSSMFTAFSDGKTSAFLSMMRTLVLLVAALLSFAALWGIGGVWFASPVAEALAFAMSLFCTLRFGKKYRYLGKTIAPPPEG